LIKGLILYRLPLVTCKNQAFDGLTFIFYTFIDMKKCRGLVIAKGYLKEHYQKEYEKLNGLFGSDWYIYQDYTIYYLVVGECETSFISLRLDLPELINGICF
jgi:hypothetical protein